MVGDFEGYVTVWYYPDAIVYIYSLYRVTYHSHVQYDSRLSGNIVLWKDGGSSCKFIPGPKRLYDCYYSKSKGLILTMKGDDLVNENKISAVKEHLKQFIQSQIHETTVTRTFQGSVGLTTVVLIWCINNKLMNSMPITRESITRAVQICKVNIVNLKCKTMQT